jgi:hypothetical protein
MSRGIVPNFAAALSSFVVEDEIDIGAAPSSSAGAASNSAAAAPTTPSLPATSPSPLVRQQQASNSTFQSLDTHVAAARARFDAAKLRCESLVAAISRTEPLGRGVSAESPSFFPSPSSSSPGGADAQPKPSAIAVEQLRAQADEAEKELKSALRELNALLQEEVVRATAAEVAKADEQLKLLLNA